MIRRGKQFLHELDGYTYLANYWLSEHHNPTTAAESVNLLRRDLAKALMDGASVWFMDPVVGGLYYGPMVEELKRILEMGRKYISKQV